MNLLCGAPPPSRRGSNAKRRLELAADVGTPEMYAKLDACKWEMLNEWAQTKRAPKHAAWVHETE